MLGLIWFRVKLRQGAIQIKACAPKVIILALCNNINVTRLFEQTDCSTFSPRVRVWVRIRLGLIWVRDKLH